MQRFSSSRIGSKTKIHQRICESSDTATAKWHEVTPSERKKYGGINGTYVDDVWER